MLSEVDAARDLADGHYNSRGSINNDAGGCLIHM